MKYGETRLVLIRTQYAVTQCGDTLTQHFDGIRGTTVTANSPEHASALTAAMLSASMGLRTPQKQEGEPSCDRMAMPLRTWPCHCARGSQAQHLNGIEGIPDAPWSNLYQWSNCSWSTLITIHQPVTRSRQLPITSSMLTNMGARLLPVELRDTTQNQDDKS